MLAESDANLPLFLFAHSMGAMVLATYLDTNPEIVGKISGVIYSAPFFGLPDSKAVGPAKSLLIKFLSLHLEEFALAAGMPVHYNTRNMPYMRDRLQTIKAIPLLSLGLQASFLRA